MAKLDDSKVKKRKKTIRNSASVASIGKDVTIEPPKRLKLNSLSSVLMKTSDGSERKMKNKLHLPLQNFNHRHVTK